MGDLEELAEDLRARGLARVLRARAPELVGPPAGRRRISGENLLELIRADPELRRFADRQAEPKPSRHALTRRAFIALGAAGLVETQIALSRAASVPDLLRQHGRGHPTVRAGAHSA